MTRLTDTAKKKHIKNTILSLRAAIRFQTMDK